MPKKEPSPLNLAQKECDALKKKVDKFLSECQSTLKKKTKDDAKHNELNKRCQEMTREIDGLVIKVEQLTPDGEPVTIPITKFESKKNDELKRLKNLKEQVNTMGQKLSPTPECVPEEVKPETPKTSQATLKKVQKTQKNGEPKEKDEDSEDGDDDEDDDGDDADDDEEDDDGEEEQTEEEDDEEEESGEEDDEDEEDDDEESESNLPARYIALEDFAAEQKGDLAFKTGEVLQVVARREDGWWEAVDSKGVKGLVPSTLLQEYKTQSDRNNEDDDDDDDDGDDDEEEDDDDDVKDASEPKEEASVEETPRTPKSGRELWKGVQKSMNETSVTDVLKALGSLPAGFRESTLAKLRLNDEYTMKSFLVPKLSQTCLSYRDLLLDHQTGKVRSKEVPIQRIVNIVCCQQMPILAEGLEVKSRHVRVCLFDGQHVLSNIITIRVSQVEKDQKTWTFSSKPETSCLEFAEFFIRTNLPSTSIGILFEICITYKRTNTSEESETSCGWVFLKLYDQKLAPVSNKTYEELINGGTPYEKGIAVDPSITRKGGMNLLQSLIAVQKQPQFFVRLTSPNKEQKELLDTLPDSLIGCTAYIQYISLYRQILADHLLRDRHDLQSTELVHSPVTSVLPDILEQPDIMNVLRAAWAEQMKIAKNREKKDMELLKAMFVKVFMENAYPIHFLSSLKSFRITDPGAVVERNGEILRVTKLGREKGFPGAVFILPDVKHKPFNVAELAFDITGPFCTSVLN